MTALVAPRRPRFTALPVIPGGWGTIAADPPWSYDDQGSRIAPDYDGMPVEDICAIPVKSIAPARGYLFCWVTSSHLHEGLQVVRAWGYRYVSSMVWVKVTAERDLEGSLERLVLQFADVLDRAREIASGDNAGVVAVLRRALTIGRQSAPRVKIGMGHHGRLAHEFVLIGERGGMTSRAADIPSVVLAPAPPPLEGQRRTHSTKPEVFQDLWERMGEGPRLELFARRARPLWTPWGNEIGSDGDAR